jgi:LysR family transcriptional regulator, cyn operon transcriptional activator
MDCHSNPRIQWNSNYVFFKEFEMLPELNGDFIQWLRGFYYTVKSGSLTAATTNMHRNQSAITYQIQSLENMYGVPLFTGGKVKRNLTEEGKFLYTKAIELFSEIGSIRSEIDQATPSAVGEIRIAAANSILGHYLPDRISSFRDQYHGASFILEGVDNLQIALQMLASRQVDFSIVHLSGIPEFFEETPLFSSGIVLISPKTGPYAFTTRPELERLVDIPFIAPPHGSALESFLSSQLTRMGLAMRKEILSSATGGAKAFASAGLGISFVRDFSVNAADSERFNIVPMEPLFKRMTYGVVRRRAMAMPLLCEKFLECLSATSTVREAM